MTDSDYRCYWDSLGTWNPIPLEDMGGSQQDQFWGRHAGGVDGFDVWYYAGHYWYQAPGAAATGVNILWACPFIAPRRASRIDNIGLYVTAVRAGFARIGIYKAKSDSSIYPGALVVDAGAIPLSGAGASLYTSTLAPLTVDLSPGDLYYASVVSNIDTPVLGTRDYTLGVKAPGSTAGVFHGIRVAQAYGALPDPYPAGGISHGGSVCVSAPALHFSA